jgi:hypothetical protein
MQSKKISENIVKKEMEKIGIPDNAVAEIMGFHGGVYGMVPREVWEMTSVPELAASTIDWLKVVWMGDGISFESVSELIRKDNWKIDCELNSLERWNGDIHKTCLLKIAIDERNIHEMIDLQRSRKWLKVNYEFRLVDALEDPRGVSGEGFLKDYTDGKITITNDSNDDSKGRTVMTLARFRKLELLHPYRRLCYCHDDASEDSDDSDYHYELSESDGGVGDTGGSPYTTL